MTTLPFEQQFVDADAIAWETVGEGVRRKILTYDANLMMVVVDFEQGGVGAMHKHYHTQISYVKSGAFTITIGDEERVLKAGDAYFIPPNVMHGAVCQEAGMLVDVFTPMREDFVG
ncbi:MAG: cupin domain-containing protein [Cytophagaceae bacterium]|nr:MAG: cupin domain-containing protein [Cytophagaceae bacterium]